ncbi:hypothetical protein NUU59_09150 [Pediococcus pentosaceus]|uniref:hypothetical protein n=1 Tax=Pediococcus pentosaceus TaxID=1255 RepID=UPI0021E8281D|nr:hypothetical protein [Pediococcus pentosaceus]MCV3330468.1 hypothetical protein [Pediococcus pentosaceus]
MKKYLNTETILLLVGMLFMLIGAVLISHGMALPLLFMGDFLIILAFILDWRGGK